MTDVFTNFKPAWHLEKIAKLREKKDIVPTHVQLIISDLCNQSCHFCAYRMDGGFSTENFPDAEGNKNPKRFMPTEKAMEILHDCAELGIQAVQFTGGGEPTVHPDHIEIIDYAQSLGLETGLVTNGVRLKNHSVFDLLTWLRVSLDAGSKRSYEQIRQSKQWDKVIDNIRLATTFKRPYLGIGFVITKENYKEIVDACELVKELGVPYIRLSAMFSRYGGSYYDGIYDRITEFRMEAKRLEDENFKVVDFFGDRVSDLELASPNYDFCGFQQFVLYIGGDQKVYTCCTNAYTTHGETGDLSNRSLSDWLQSYRRYDFNAKSCHHCQFNDKNKLVNYLLDPKPPHVDFV